VTCHDGFTLEDLVSYDVKHNEANGEDNRDGTDDNASWNCGIEGPTDDPAIEALRGRQIRNFLTLLMLSVGTPMLTMGDEVRRTQRGNNNAYCQDGEVSWLDWTLVDRHAGLRRFVRQLIEFREHRDVIVDPNLTLSELLSRAPIEWHGIALDLPDWSYESHSLAFTITAPSGSFKLHGMLNAYWEALEFALPMGPRPWRRWIDTSRPSPEDIVPWGGAVEIAPGRCRVQARSVVVAVVPSDGGSNPEDAVRSPIDESSNRRGTPT
jgi:glycogen operon protein